MCRGDTTLTECLLLKTEIVNTGYITDCELWVGSVDPTGYGVIHGRRAHLVAWEEAYGSVPDGLVLDHICHSFSVCEGGVCIHRRCKNLFHLEPVTREENIKRGKWFTRTHCSHGHEFTLENIRWEKTNKGYFTRRCLICRHEQEKRSRQKYLGIPTGSTSICRNGHQKGPGRCRLCQNAANRKSYQLRVLNGQ